MKIVYQLNGFGRLASLCYQHINNQKQLHRKPNHNKVNRTKSKPNRTKPNQNKPKPNPNRTDIPVHALTIRYTQLWCTEFYSSVNLDADMFWKLQLELKRPIKTITLLQVCDSIFCRNVQSLLFSPIFLPLQNIKVQMLYLYFIVQNICFIMKFFVLHPGSTKKDLSIYLKFYSLFKLENIQNYTNL